MDPSHCSIESLFNRLPSFGISQIPLLNSLGHRNIYWIEVTNTEIEALQKKNFGTKAIFLEWVDKTKYNHNETMRESCSSDSKASDWHLEAAFDVFYTKPQVKSSTDSRHSEKLYNRYKGKFYHLKHFILLIGQNKNGHV
ncbi:hypothetical protein L1987_26428 [Smallanthus sonchifolius]|uniref:Uncharacterized protein n=1 Tax=Smallanthus sonchifolius TaxID=185202 RepID=A0ACB9IA51_9ASTR|nr:hypothetical protein L1987_26428 [Smallanthus sonchifolius]